MKNVETIWPRIIAVMLLVASQSSVSPVAAAQGGIAIAGIGSGAAPAFASNGVYFGLGNSGGIFRPLTNALFDNYHIFPSDIGHVFTANSATDPDFNFYVAGLSDGFPGIEWEFATQPCCFQTEGRPTQNIFLGLPPDGHGEFYGYNITSIDLRVVQLEDRPSEFGNLVRFGCEVSIYYEPVPEPAMASFLGLGTLMWYVLRRIRRSCRSSNLG